MICVRQRTPPGGFSTGRKVGGFAELQRQHGRFAREQEIYLQITRRWRNLIARWIAEVHGKCIAGTA